MSFTASDPNIHDPSFSSNVTVFDKSTQTSTINFELMSSDQTPTKPSETKESTCKDDNIKVFEFCELVKDPQDDTVSIVKETFTEEVILSSEGSIFPKPTHNRYKYCREVIQPYCKTHTSACPKYPTHREIPFKKSLFNTSADSKKLVIKDSGTIIMAPDDKKTTFENPSKTPSDLSLKKKRQCPPTLPINTEKECRKEGTNCEPYSECPHYKDEAKLKEYLSSCLSTTITMAKKASATCIDKCEKTIGIRQPKCGEEKPTYYELKKPKSKENVVHKSSYESILDSEIVQNLKSGVKSVVGTVINKTKDIFSSSSCKDLNPGKDRKPKDCENKSLTKVPSILPNKIKSVEDSTKTSHSNSIIKIEDDSTNTFKSQDKINESSSLSKIATILTNPFKSKDNNADSTKSSLTKITSIFTNKFNDKEISDSEDKSLTRIKSIISSTYTKSEEYATSVKDSVDVSKMVEPTVAAIERVASAVSTVVTKTVSTVQDVKKSLSITNIINSRLEKSSPEDNPNIIRRKPPENVSHEHEHDQSQEPDDSNPSMFTMLKTKLFSMFADSNEDDVDESDDEDENYAEKIFNKHCYP